MGPGAGHECQSARGPPPAPTTVSSGATPVLRAGSQSALPDRGEEWGRETAGWLAGCGGRGARAPTLPCPAPFLRVRLVGPRRRRAEPAWGGPGRAGAGARPGRGRNAPVLLRAVGLAVGCPQRPLLRPVRGSQLQRAGVGEGRLRRGRALERRAGGEGG